MLNINYGHNERILKACKRLHDYSYFMKEVNTGLDKCKSEVFNMLLTEYDEKKHLKHGREEGKEEGMKEVMKKTAVNMLSLGMSIDVIEKITGLTEAEIKALSQETD